MVAAGSIAPSFEIEGHTFPGPNTVVAFYKVTCPTCKLALPFLHRFNREVIGVSQDDEDATANFKRENEVRISSLIDKADSDYPVSSAYGIEYVPTLFVIDENGKIAECIEGFNKAAFEALGVVFSEAEKVPVYKPG